jgi:hypothetical protein
VIRSAASDDLDVLLGAAQLERRIGTRQRAGDVEHQAGWHNGDPGPFNGRLEWDPEPDLHIGRAKLSAPVFDKDLDPGQGLDRAAG